MSSLVPSLTPRDKRGDYSTQALYRLIQTITNPTLTLTNGSTGLVFNFTFFSYTKIEIFYTQNGENSMATPVDPFALIDWHRTNAELYDAIRTAPVSEREQACAIFRAARDVLFRIHPQSPLASLQKESFSGLQYFAYHPAWRTTGRLHRDVDRETFTVQISTEEEIRFTRVAKARFLLNNEPAELNLYWMEGYPGGLFLPFRDTTNGEETYSDGRYLYDTGKGADLGVTSKEIELDFNFAYNPPSAYREGLTCPLPPQENKIPFRLEAGELGFH